MRAVRSDEGQLRAGRPRRMRTVSRYPGGRRVSYSRPVPENSPKNQHVADESVDLSAMARELEPALSGLRELLAPLAQAIARPLAQAIEREQARLATALAPFAQEIERGRAAENLLEQGWVPNFATPYDLVAKPGPARRQSRRGRPMDRAGGPAVWKTRTIRSRLNAPASRRVSHTALDGTERRPHAPQARSLYSSNTTSRVGLVHPLRIRWEKTDRPTSLRSDERSRSPESVFTIPGFGVQLHRNAHQCLGSGRTTLVHGIRRRIVHRLFTAALSVCWRRKVLCR